MASLPDGGAVLSIQRNPRRLTPQFDGVRQFRQRLPIQNLPFGVFRRTDPAEAPRGGIAIGDMILDVSTCAANFTGLAAWGGRLRRIEPEWFMVLGPDKV